LGRRFRRAAEAAFLRAGEQPYSGKPGIAETRRILVKGFPFSVVYLVSETEVMVYAVAHLSREPHYWIGRLPNKADE
jgi:toxin ParE1/3/4